MGRMWQHSTSHGYIACFPSYITPSGARRKTKIEPDGCFIQHQTWGGTAWPTKMGWRGNEILLASKQKPWRDRAWPTSIGWARTLMGWGGRERQTLMFNEISSAPFSDTWEGFGNTLLDACSLFSLPFYLSCNCQLRDSSFSTKPEVVEHGQQGWVEVEVYGQPLWPTAIVDSL